MTYIYPLSIYIYISVAQRNGVGVYIPHTNHQRWYQLPGLAVDASRSLHYFYRQHQRSSFEHGETWNLNHLERTPNLSHPISQKPIFPGSIIALALVLGQPPPDASRFQLDRGHNKKAQQPTSLWRCDYRHLRTWKFYEIATGTID